MGYQAGLHVLSPEESSGAPPFTVLVGIGGVFAGIVIVGILARTCIELAKDGGDELVDRLFEAWHGGGR